MILESRIISAADGLRCFVIKYIILRYVEALAHLERNRRGFRRNSKNRDKTSSQGQSLFCITTRWFVNSCERYAIGRRLILYTFE